MEVEKSLLGTIDYVIFTLMLLVSAGIGVYFRFSGGKQKTTEEYLLAGQNMSILPVAFSLMATSLSAINIIGIPAEIYKFGIHLAYANIGYSLGTILSSYLSLPVYFNMQISTVYQYLEKRFGKLVRTLCSLAFVLQMILYVSAVLYAPALALSAVTNLSTWVSVVSIGAVCTFYCTLGGVKAVLWTDVFQAILMFLSILAVLVKGFTDLGNVTNVLKTSYDGGRIALPGLEFDLEVRYTAWNLQCQGIILSMSAFMGNQVQVQRMLTLKNVSRSRKATIFNIPLGGAFHLLTCLAGLVIYAHYAHCDPMTAPSKPISSADQLMPFFIMSSFKEYPGLSGLCICGIFSASLSTVSSAVNSLTAVTMQDLDRPFFISTRFSEKNAAFSAKIITLFYGLLCIALTFLVSSFGNILQASMTIYGMLGGPILAVFVLGMMTTRANEKGVVFGLVTSIVLTAWMSFGAAAYARPSKTLPVSIEGCFSSNFTTQFQSLNTTFSTFSTVTTDIIASRDFSLASTLNATKAIIKEYKDTSYIYRVSYMWFGTIGFISSFVLGYFASIIYSLITGNFEMPPVETLSPLMQYFLKKKSTDSDKREKNISNPFELPEINCKSED